MMKWVRVNGPPEARVDLFGDTVVIAIVAISADCVFYRRRILPCALIGLPEVHGEPSGLVRTIPCAMRLEEAVRGWIWELRLQPERSTLLTQLRWQCPTPQAVNDLLGEEVN